MAQFTHSLCEEVIKTDGKCGLTRNEMVQMARLALRALKNENPLLLDAIRYRFLRDTKKSRIAGMLEYSGFITDQVLDDLIDNAMSSVAGEKR
jgi:hypothetical protein